MMLKAKATQQRKSTTLPTETVEYLKNWMMSPEHINHPYPTEREKAQIMADTGIGVKPLTNWFVNNRKRYWKPRYEARLQQQKAEAAKAKMAGGTAPSPGVPASTSVLITASPPPQSATRQYLGRRVSIDASTTSSRNGLISTNMTSSLRYHASPAVRAVSIGSASSLSSELSDGNSFDDDDSVAFASPGRKVRSRRGINVGTSLLMIKNLMRHNTKPVTLLLILEMLATQPPHHYPTLFLNNNRWKSFSTSNEADAPPWTAATTTIATGVQPNAAE